MGAIFGSTAKPAATTSTAKKGNYGGVEGGLNASTSAGDLAKVQSETTAARKAEEGATATAAGSSNFGNLMAGGGSIAEGIGDIMAGDTANAVGMYNQGVARAQAREIEAKTGFDVRRMAEESNRGMSSMEVAGGASGAVGGNLMAMAKQASEDELSMLMRSREGAIGVGQARAEGKMARWQGKQAQRQGYITGGTKIAQGAATMLAGF